MSLLSLSLNRKCCVSHQVSVSLLVKLSCTLTLASMALSPCLFLRPHLTLQDLCEAQMHLRPSTLPSFPPQVIMSLAARWVILTIEQRDPWRRWSQCWNRLLAPEQVQDQNPGAHPSAIFVRLDLEPDSSQPRIHHIISVKDFFLFKWCYYVHRVEIVAITALLLSSHITFAYRLKTTKICSLSLLPK